MEAAPVMDKCRTVGVSSAMHLAVVADLIKQQAVMGCATLEQIGVGALAMGQALSVLLTYPPYFWVAAVVVVALVKREQMMGVLRVMEAVSFTCLPVKFLWLAMSKLTAREGKQLPATINTWVQAAVVAQVARYSCAAGWYLSLQEPRQRSAAAEGLQALREGAAALAELEGSTRSTARVFPAPRSHRLSLMN